jgi:hypothetical protein
VNEEFVAGVTCHCRCHYVIVSFKATNRQGVRRNSPPGSVLCVCRPEQRDVEADWVVDAAAGGTRQPDSHTG